MSDNSVETVLTEPQTEEVDPSEAPPQSEAAPENVPTPEVTEVVPEPVAEVVPEPVAQPVAEVVPEVVLQFPPQQIVDDWANQMAGCAGLIEQNRKDPTFRFYGRPHLKEWVDEYKFRVVYLCQLAEIMLGRSIKISKDALDASVNNVFPALKTFYDYHLEATKVGCKNAKYYEPYIQILTELTAIATSCTKRL